MAIAIAIILDARRIKENQKYPVKLRVNYQWDTLNFQTIFDLSKEDYEKLPAPRINTELQTIKSKLKQIEREAEACIKNLADFSFHEFENTFIQFNPLFRPRKQKFRPASSL